MKQFEFNYLKYFSCIGGSCAHNCCIGWKIKVNKKAFDNYNALKQIDKRFSSDCFDGKDFRLINGRCPFLEQDNLCYIIKNYGQKSLCKTCKTHPRFKSFFTGITETGLGLYCEQACKIILSQKSKMKLVLIKDDKKKNNLSPLEKKIFSFRKKVIDIIQNRALTTEERLAKLQVLSNIQLNKKSFSDWINVFCKLEKLPFNEFWFDTLRDDESFADTPIGFEKEFEQLLSYLAFRHLSRAIDSLDLRVRLGFVILSFMVINHIFSKAKEQTFTALVESCRFFSSTIECSDDNIFALLNTIEDLVSFI